MTLSWLSSQLIEDTGEIVETLLAGDPLGGADGAEGEAATVLGVVREQDAVFGRVEEDDVHADGFAFAHRRDLELLSGGALHHFLDHDGGAGGCVLLVDVMTLHD